MSTVISSLEELIKRQVHEEKLDPVAFINDPRVVASWQEAADVVGRLLAAEKATFSAARNDLSIPLILEKTGQLGGVTGHLADRLQELLRMVDHRNSRDAASNKPNAVIECDQAKMRADRLIKILKAKIVYTNTFDELQLLDEYAASPADQNLRFQKLVTLQQSFDVLKEFPLNPARVMELERQKDQFLAWHSSAIILAIEANDGKQLDSLKDKFSLLNRLTVFEQSFFTYAENKIQMYIDGDQGGKEGTAISTDSIWKLLLEVFAIWRRCVRLADAYTESETENNSSRISDALFAGVCSRWARVSEWVAHMQTLFDSPFAVVQELGKIRKDIGDLTATGEADEHLGRICMALCQRLFDLTRDDYARHVTSQIVCAVNKVTVPDRSRHRLNWIFPYLDEIQSCLHKMVVEAFATFGADSPDYVVPSIELGIRELNSLLQNHDILNLRTRQPDIRPRKSVQENTEDKISAICVTGYLLNMIDYINAYIVKERSAAQQLVVGVGAKQTVENSTEAIAAASTALIGNRHLIESLNASVVERKIESIAKAIIYSMVDEIEKLKKSLPPATGEKDAEKKGGADSSQLKLALPAFSVTPHNYMTTLGHGLLNQMNTISSYAADKNFVQAITSASSTAGEKQNDEPDLWLLTEVGALVQNAFCASVGPVPSLGAALVRQLNADTVFLLEALVDLRLQPTPQLAGLALRLKDAATASQQ